MKRVAMTAVTLFASLILFFASSAFAVGNCPTTAFPYGVAPSSGAPASVTIYIPNMQSALTQVVPFTVTNGSGAGFQSMTVSVPNLPAYLTASVIHNHCTRSAGGLPAHGTCTFSVALTSDGSTEGSGFVLQPKVRDDVGGACHQSPVGIPVSVAQASLSSITVAPPAGSSSPVSIPISQNIQFSAIGNYSDGYHPDISSLVNWSVSPSAMATVGNGSDGGLVTGAAVGTGSVIASLNGATGSAPFTVTNPLISLAVTPPNASILVGKFQQYTATGTYADNSTQNLTNSVSWTSSYPNVASINPTGSVTGEAVGDSTITASTTNILGQTVTNNVPLVVTNPLVLLTVTPANAKIGVNATQQYVATGTYADGSTQVLDAAWTSTDSAVATIDPSSGLAKAVGAGDTTITATAGLMGSVPLVVAAAPQPALVGIAITPPTAAITAGGTQQFQAIGFYADKSQKNITNQATWAVTAGSAAGSVSAQGLVTTNGAVSAQTQMQIKATLGSVTSANPAVLTVNPAPPVLKTITVSPTNIVLNAAQSQQFTALGKYSDGSSKDITNNVTWTYACNGAYTCSGTLVSGNFTVADAVTSFGGVLITATQGTVSGTAQITSNG